MIKSTSKDNKSDFSIGLDIGTSKICMMISQKDHSTNSYKLLGFGITESDGINRGVVNNLDKVSLAIEKVVSQVQNQSGYEIKEAVVGIAGDHIKTIFQKGLITIPIGDTEISKDDVIRLIDEAKKTTLSADNKIIHAIPLNFIVDSNLHTNDPIGMAGVRLEADIMLITANNSAINNLTRCVERAGLKLKELVLEPIASSYATLTEEEKEIGVALIDIGGGTTDIAVYSDKSLKYTSIIGVGGKLITTDIRKVLGITETNAETIKKEFGSCSIVENEQIINIPLGAGNKPKEIKKSELSEIIRSRCIEMLQFVKYELVHSNTYDNLGAGVILTGGCSLIEGIVDLASEVLELPVKIGIPTGFSMTALAPDISSPLYSTAVGLTLMGHHSVANELNTEKSVSNNNNASNSMKKNMKFFEDEVIENESVVNSESSDSIVHKVKEPKNFWKKLKDIAENI